MDGDRARTGRGSAAAARAVGRPTRRRVLAGLSIGLAAVAVSAHTPYNQWNVYRKKHLLILTNKVETGAHQLGLRLAELVAEVLPESGARVTRAPSLQRVASLLSSDQLRIALTGRRNAIAMATGLPPFADYGGIALSLIATFGEFALICREDVPDRHTWLLARALDEVRAELPLPMHPAGGERAFSDPFLPLHPGAAAYFAGEAPPPREG